VDEVYHTFLAHSDSLGCEVVILGHAQREGDVGIDAEAPGASLRLVPRLVVDLGGDRVRPIFQALGGGVSEALGGVDLGGDYLAVQYEGRDQGLDPSTRLTCACAQVQARQAPEPGVGSDRLAEMSGQALVMTEPVGGARSVMSGGSPSYRRVKRVVHSAWLPTWSSVWMRR
jgi:hypothetical protein